MKIGDKITNPIFGNTIWVIVEFGERFDPDGICKKPHRFFTIKRGEIEIKLPIEQLEKSIKLPKKTKENSRKFKRIVKK